MGMIFSAPEGRVQMVVDNPGHEDIVRGFTDDGDPLSLTGPQRGRLPEETTRRALGNDADPDADADADEPGQHPVLDRSDTTARPGG